MQMGMSTEVKCISEINQLSKGSQFKCKSVFHMGAVVVEVDERPAVFGTSLLISRAEWSVALHSVVLGDLIPERGVLTVLHREEIFLKSLSEVQSALCIRVQI